MTLQFATHALGSAGLFDHNSFCNYKQFGRLEIVSMMCVLSLVQARTRLLTAGKCGATAAVVPYVEYACVAVRCSTRVPRERQK